MLTLKYNPATERFDCYKGLNYILPLTGGTKSNLYIDDEGIIVAGRIEYQSWYGYYWIDNDNYTSLKLISGMKGTLE